MAKFQTQFSHGKVEPLKCLDPSLTEQCFEAQSNINNMINANIQSFLPQQTKQALYGLSITGDEYEKSLNAASEVKNYFEELPVKAKQYFHYNPSEMLDFVQNNANYEKAYEIGLIDKKSYFAFKDTLKQKQSNLLNNDIQTASTVTTEASEVNHNSNG